jgi:hypothetical protein
MDTLTLAQIGEGKVAKTGGVDIYPKKTRLTFMNYEDDLKRELEKAKSQVEYERVRAKNLADRAETEALHQKDKSNEILAIVLVLLICSVLIILGLTGVFN